MIAYIHIQCASITYYIMVHRRSSQNALFWNSYIILNALYISQTTKDAMRSVTMAACGAYTVIYRLREGHSALVDIGFPILLVSIYIVNRRLYY